MSGNFDYFGLRARLDVLRRLQLQAKAEIGALVLDRGRITDPADKAIVKQWRDIYYAAKVEATGIEASMQAEDENRRFREKQRELDRQEADQRANRRREKREKLTLCAFEIDGINGKKRCGNRFHPDNDNGTELCLFHRKARSADPGVHVEKPAQPIDKPWKYWGSSVEDVALVLPVREVEEVERDGDHLISDTIDRRTEAILARAPWAVRAPRSRRYEGFRRPQ